MLELYHRFIKEICNEIAIFFIVAAFELNLLKTAKPFVERWMRKQLGFRAFLRKIKENLPYWKDLGKVINLVRKKSKLTQAQLAAACGVVLGLYGN